MVHIVYCTTNLINKKIYVGIHKTENPYKFDGYLGNGLWCNDAYYLNHPKEPFHYAVKKYGSKNFIRKTLAVFEGRKEALKMEAEIVNEEFIKRADTYNITLGGGEPPTYCKTIYQYSLEGDFIKEWKSITEAALFYECSSCSIGRAIFDRTSSHKYLWSETKYVKLDLDLFHLDENKVVTYLYDLEGKYIDKFKSISDCARVLEITPSRVQHSIKGKGCIKKQWYVSDVKYELFPIPKKSCLKDKKVFQYSLEGVFIREWKMNKELQEAFNNKNMCSRVNESIKQGHSYKGFQWSYEKLPFMKKLEYKSGRIRKVGRYTLEGELIETFNSVNEAKRAWGSGAVNVLRGNNKTCRGFLFKYID